MAFGTNGVFQGASISSSNTASNTNAGGKSGGSYGGVISGLTQMATGIINANRIKDTANFNTQMLDLDKRLVRLSAGVAIKNIRRNAMSLFSTQRAGFAKAGLSIEGGQAAIMAESLKESELDAIFTQINADLGVSAIETKQRSIQTAARSGAMDQYINIGSSILQTGTKYKGR